MAEHDLMEAFEDCVGRLAEGQSIDDCLRAHPHHTSTLRPMLEAGRLVRRMRYTPQEIASAQNRAYPKVLAAINTPQSSIFAFIRRPLAAVASFLLIVFLTAGGLSVVAENSLPGDPLYGFKLFTESARLALIGDDDLRQNFDRRRLDEIERLLAAGREASVIFRGTVETIDDTTWRVAGLGVQVAATTPGAPGVQVGDTIEVEGRTVAVGILIATAIHPLPDQTTPADRVEPSPTPTSTATAMPSDTPEPSNTPTPTATPVPSDTPEPAATATPTATASATLDEETSQSGDDCTPGRPEGWISYRVQLGDILSALAVGSGGIMDEIATVNCIANRGQLLVGQVLYLPRVPVLPPSPTATVEAVPFGSPQTIAPPPPDGNDDRGGGGDDNESSGNDDPPEEEHEEDDS